MQRSSKNEILKRGDYMNIKGMHHFTGITKDANKNKMFYTQVLGLRLVKISVNQDTGENYHLFYADEKGHPGTDFTFFEIKNAGRTHPGTNSISKTSFRVKNNDALAYWHKRLNSLNVKTGDIKTIFGMQVFDFEDHEKQRLMMVSDDNQEFGRDYTVHKHENIKPGFEIRGLGPVFLTVKKVSETVSFLKEVLAYDLSGAYEDEKLSETKIFVLESKNPGHHGAIHVLQKSDIETEKPGVGSVHHIALSVSDETALEYWQERLNHFKYKNSGIVDRHYFKAIYVKDSNNIQYELSSESPGFTVDETIDQLGKSLSLPEKLEHKRDDLEKNIDFW